MIIFLAVALVFFAYSILFNIKHFVADYPLQTPYMLGKFKGGTEWIGPLSAHCGVHAVMTLLITWTLVPLHIASLFALFDFSIHFIMDRIKASPRLLGRYKALSAADFLNLSKGFAPYRPEWGPKTVGSGTETHIVVMPTVTEDVRQMYLASNKKFWVALGLDQLVHHVTDLTIILGMLTYVLWSL